MAGRVLAVALIALICAWPAGAVTVDDLPSGGVLTVRAIRIEGRTGVSRRALRNVMLTRVPPWYQPWKPRRTFNPMLFRSDLERVRGFLRESGYYQARVSHDLERTGESLDVVITVDAGPAARVTDIAIESADFTPTSAEEAERRSQLTIAAGHVFTQEAYDESRDRIERYYLERGFTYAKVTKVAAVNTAAAGVHVAYTIERGPAAVFGDTRVSGTVRVAERLVRREIAYRRGDPYDPRKLEQTQARIFGLRLFRSATVQPATGLPAGSGVADVAIVDVAITVVEGPPREIQAGIGYGLEDEIRGQLRWQHNDFFGGGRQLGVRLKGSAIAQAFEGEFRQPYFLHPRQTLIVPLSQAREDEPGFTVARVRLAPRVDRQPFADTKVSLGYTVEYDDLSSVPNNTIKRLQEFEARGVVSSMNAVLERNTTLDLLDPKQGSVLNITAEQAGGPWQGDFSFYRAIAEGKAYLPVPGDRVLAGRVRIGAGDGYGQSRDLPLFRRFFAGGINSTRGYDRHLVGPLDDRESPSPVGGRSLLEASAELRTPIYDKISGVVFFDVGEVRRRAFSYTTGDLQFGTGVGVRYHTAIGPFRLDVGFPFEPPPGEPSWKIHFSIGQAF